MKFLFSINTEGQYHTWKILIRSMLKRGDSVFIFARNYGCNFELMNQEGLKFSKFESVKSPIFKVFDLYKYFVYSITARFKIEPDYVFGFGVDAGIIAKICAKPSIIFNDSEPLGMQNFLIKQLSSVIITPQKLSMDFGNRHMRVASYKEFAYLHPQNFIPDPEVLNMLGVEKDQKYVILRFNGFDAVHDIGHNGFSVEEKHKLVKVLNPHARVFISSETKLPDQLKEFELSIPVNQIHNALFYAHLVVTDTQTMATEAAVLGVPTIRCNSFVGSHDMSNFIELENEYGLVFSFKCFEQSANKALEIITQEDVKACWAEKRKRLIENKMDLTSFFMSFIENLPRIFDEKAIKNRY